MNVKNQKLIRKQKSKNELNKENKIEKIISKDWFIIVLFIAATLIAYSNSFNVPFQFDDDQQIVINESNHNLHNFSHLSYWFQVNNRPVSTLSLVLNYILNGENVVGYHVVNLIIHLLSGIILFFWLKLIISFRENNHVSKWLPVVIAMFFLLHPVQTQSVTYIVQRMTSLAGMFFLLSVFLYTKGRIVFLKSNKSNRAIGFYIFAIITGLLGAFSKQNAIVFPLAFLLIELFFIRDSNGKIFKRYLITVVSIGIVFSTAFLLKYGLPYETKEIVRLQYFATQMTVIPRYFQMMLIPFGLSIDHGIKAVKNIFELKVFVGASLLIGILIFAVSQLKKRPLVSFGILWIYIALIIESSIFPISDVMFDQRMYLPLVGFSIAFWALTFNIVSKLRPKLLFPIILTFLLAMSVWTYARNYMWQSNIAIWEEVTKLYPDHFRGWQGLGREYVASGEKDVSKIIHCYQMALKIEPKNETVLNDLAANYLKNGNFSQAIDCSLKLVDSKNLDYRLNALRILGIIYLESKNYDLAIKYLEKIIQVKPDDTAVLQNLSSLYIQLADYNKAIQYSEKALEILPNEILPLMDIGYSQINMGRSDLSKKYLLKALSISPENTRALVLYANACINTGKFEEAISCLKKTYEITKDGKYLLDIKKVEKIKQHGL
jgi:protein O-mannosyl-transferase